MMVKKKKFYILSDAVTSTTGNARVAKGLLKGLKKLGYEVANIALGADEPEYEYEGIKMLPLTQHGFGDPQVKMFLHKLELYLERDKPDYFVILGDKVHYQGLGVGNFSRQFFDGNGIKMIFWETIDSDSILELENQYRNPLNPKIDMHKTAHHIVTTSEYGKNVIEEEFVKVDKVIWEFVDVNEFYPVGKEKKTKIRAEYRFRKDDFIFMMVGRAARRKNHELAIEAIYPLLIEYPDARLFCVIPDYDEGGKGINLIDFCSRVMPKRYGGRDLIGEQKISFCTMAKEVMRISMGVPDDEMVKFYQLSDATIAGSSNEGFNLVIGETLAVGNHYIGINNTTVPELTNNGEVGFIAPSDFRFHVGLSISINSTNVETLRKEAKKVLELHKNQDEDKKVRDKNRRFVENRLTSGMCVVKWHKFLGEIEGEK